MDTTSNYERRLARTNETACNHCHSVAMPGRQQCDLHADWDPTDDDTVPASRIMRERDEAKQAWAQEYTRANLLEASLERSQQATEDWRVIALQNGEELAKARVECARLCNEIHRLRHKNDPSAYLTKSGGEYRLVRCADDLFRLEGSEWSETGSGTKSVHQYFKLEHARKFAATCQPPVDVDAMEVAR